MSQNAAFCDSVFKRFSELDQDATASNKNARIEQSKDEDLHELRVRLQAIVV